MKGKGRTVKRKGMPKKHSDMTDCVLFKRRLIFFSHLQLKNEHGLLHTQLFLIYSQNTALGQGQVLPDPEAKS